MDFIAFIIAAILSIPLVYITFELARFLLGWYWKFLRCTLFYASRNISDICGNESHREKVGTRELNRNYIYETPLYFFICLGLTEAILAWFVVAIGQSGYLLNFYFVTGFGFCFLYFSGLRKRFPDLKWNGGVKKSGIEESDNEGKSEYKRILVLNRDFMKTCIVPISFVVAAVMFYLSAIAWEGLVTDQWSAVIIGFLQERAEAILGELIYENWFSVLMGILFFVPAMFLIGYLSSLPFQFGSYYYVLILIYRSEHQDERQRLKEDIWWKRLRRARIGHPVSWLLRERRQKEETEAFKKSNGKESGAP